MGNILKFKYKLGAWQVLLKPFDLNTFLSHMIYGRKQKLKWFPCYIFGIIEQFQISHFGEGGSKTSEPIDPSTKHLFMPACLRHQNLNLIYFAAILKFKQETSMNEQKCFQQ